MTDASHAEPHGLDLQEQIARIARAQADTDKLSAETRKLFAEADKLRGDVRWQPVLAWTATLTAGLASLASVLTILLRH